MKYKLPPIVKEQMRFVPDLPAKASGPTSQKRDWSDYAQAKDVKSKMGFKGQVQDKLGLESYDEGMVSMDEHKVLSRDIGYDVDYEHQTLNVVSNNPQHDPENNFRDFCSVNDNYDSEHTNFTPRFLRDGHMVVPLNGLTNEYTGQHFVGFYHDEEREDKMTGEISVGFLERNNFLDRL